MVSVDLERFALRIPEALWRVPIYLPYLQPPLTDGAVAKAEARLGVGLPRAYVAALRIQNGGYLRLSSLPSEHPPVDFLAGVGPRFPSILRRDWSAVAKAMTDQGLTPPPSLDALVPFCGDGHYEYCLDYRKSGKRSEPRVTYVDAECFRFDEVIAPDFMTFLGQLRPDGAAQVYGLVTRDEAKRVAAALSKATGYRFEDRGDQDNGYRVFRARLPGTGSWAWLSANGARRGFVRKTDAEYEKLHELYPEWVDRHPEHPDCGYFLSCTDFEGTAGKAIVRGLGKLPFAARTVRLGES
jgi:hypothetical protein